MWLRIRTLIIKELLASALDAKTRWLVLYSPPLLLLIYAFAITQEVKNITVAVYNEDAGTLSRDLIARFDGAPTFSEILYFDNWSLTAAAVDSRRAAMAIRIDSTFSRNLAARKQTQVQLILDGRRSNTAQILEGYSARIVADFNRELAGEAVRPPTIVVTRAWFNPNFEPLWSATPALFAVLTMVVGFMVSALTIARERELGTFEQLLVSPIRPLEIMIGKAVPAILIALASAVAMLALGWFVLQVPLRGSLILLFGAMIVFLTSIVGIGLFISSLASNQQQAVIGLFFYMMPAVLISGYATPVENMPDWLQWLAETDPIMHFIVICKGVFLKDVPASVIFAHTWPMALIAVFTLSAAAWLFRKKLT